MTLCPDLPRGIRTVEEVIDESDASYSSVVTANTKLIQYLLARALEVAVDELLDQTKSKNRTRAPTGIIKDTNGRFLYGSVPGRYAAVDSVLQVNGSEVDADQSEILCALDEMFGPKRLISRGSRLVKPEYHPDYVPMLNVDFCRGSLRVSLIDHLGSIPSELRDIALDTLVRMGDRDAKDPRSGQRLLWVPTDPPSSRRTGGEYVQPLKPFDDVPRRGVYNHLVAEPRLLDRPGEVPIAKLIEKFQRLIAQAQRDTDLLAKATKATKRPGVSVSRDDFR